MDMSPDAADWPATRTLADLGELPALFLKGQIQQTPTDGGPPDPETAPLIPVLAACNRAGFITHMSQPGIMPNRHGSAQRADVSGYASSETFARLTTVVAGADLIVTPRAPSGAASAAPGRSFPLPSITAGNAPGMGARNHVKLWRPTTGRSATPE